MKKEKHYIQKYCIQCEKTFYAFLSQIKAGRKYCSLQCKNKSQETHEIRQCLYCKTEFKSYLCYRKRGGGKYCSHECEGKSRDKKSLCKCLLCGKSVYRDQSHIKNGGGKYCSSSCSGKGNSGSNHFWWKGGITPVRDLIRNNLVYKKWRTSVFTRDNFTCTICRKKERMLEADHKYPFALILDKFKITSLDEALECSFLWDIENGQTLCKNCHKNTPSYLNRWMFKSKITI